MVTYCVTKMVTTYSPMIGQCFDTTLVASVDKKWLSLMTLQNLSLSKWKHLR